MKGIRKNSWDFVLNCVRDSKLTWLRIWAPEIYMTHIHVLWDCLHSVHPPVMFSSLMYVFLAGVSYLIRARCTLSFFFFFNPPTCCQCVPWPVDWNMPAVCLTTFDAKWLIYLLCNTPILLLWNPPPLCFHLRNLGVDVVHFIRHWLCKTVFLLLTSGCWAVTCWDDIVLFIDCTFVCLSGPLQRSHRMSWPLINSTGLVRACYPVHFLANCSSH